MANRKLLASRHAARAQGLSLIELMIAIALGLLVIAAVLALFVNISRTNNEMAKMNRQIENGRFAIQLLQEDVVHAGFWGGHVPQFDDLTVVAAPLDAPNALPAPCLAHSAANWDATYIANLIGIPMQGYEAAPAGCAVVSNKQIDTDVLVVRYAKTCVAGVGSCESDTAGKLYFQSSLCENEVSGAAQGGDSTSITLDAGASAMDNFYRGTVIRIIAGPGAGESRTVTGYVGATKVATVNSSWPTIPDNSSVYAFGAFGLGYVLGTDGYVFTKRDCATQADKRKLVSNIYYIRDHASTPGDGIPTLMRSSLDLAGGVLAHQGAEPLIEGIQGFRVEYGIDKVSKTGAAVNYTNSVAWENPYNRISPKNRGDGIPETYVSAADLTCNGIADCDAANVVAARIHVLARNLEPTPGYTDSKTYQLGNTPAGTPFTMGPFNDRFKRHVFSTTVRLANPAGRRDTP